MVSLRNGVRSLLMWFKVAFNTLQTTCKAFLKEAFVLPYSTILRYKGKGVGLMDKGFTKP